MRSDFSISELQLLQPAYTCSDNLKGFHLEMFAMPAVMSAGKGTAWCLNLNHARLQLKLIHRGRTC